MKILPIYQNSSPRWEYHIELDGVVYIFNFRWNDRGQSWFLDVWDNERSPIISGIRLTPNYRLLEPYRASIPSDMGDLICWDTTQIPDPGEIGFDALGNRFLLMYVTKSELMGAA